MLKWHTGTSERECHGHAIYKFAGFLGFLILCACVVYPKELYTMRLSTDFALLALSSVCLGQGYTNESEVPFYGQSPPVYPSRKYQSLKFVLVTIINRSI